MIGKEFLIAARPLNGWFNAHTHTPIAAIAKQIPKWYLTVPDARIILFRDCHK